MVCPGPLRLLRSFVYIDCTFPQNVIFLFLLFNFIVRLQRYHSDMGDAPLIGFPTPLGLPPLKEVAGDRSGIRIGPIIDEDEDGLEVERPWGPLPPP